MRISSPRGFVPRARGCNLPPEYAEHAENLNVASGRFQPWRVPEKILQFHEPIRSVHVSDCCWTGTHVCGAHYVDAGLDKKTYLSGPADSQPMVTDDVCEPAWCALGYPVPDAPQLLPDTCDRLTFWWQGYRSSRRAGLTRVQSARVSYLQLQTYCLREKALRSRERPYQDRW